MTCDVSVVIPAWNAAHLLPRCLESVLAQTLAPREIIVVDDGSRDATAEVAANCGYAVRVIRQENRGAAGARNTGIRAAAGKWIAFLDADDRWLPQKMERLIACAAANPDAGVIYSDATVMDDAGRPVGRFLDGKDAASGYIYDRLLRSFFVLPSTAMVRRELIERAGYFAEKVRGVEDMELMLRLARATLFALVPECLVIYERQETSVSRNEAMMAENSAMVFASLLSEELTAKQRRAVRTRLASTLFDLAWHQREKNPALALNTAWRSVRANPRRLPAWKLLVANAATVAAGRQASGEAVGRTRPLS